MFGRLMVGELCCLGGRSNSVSTAYEPDPQDGVEAFRVILICVAVVETNDLFIIVFRQMIYGGVLLARGSRAYMHEKRNVS